MNPSVPFPLDLSRVGTVYGVLLNDRAALEALGEAVNQPPYKAPPRAPVLYIKPRNTFAADGDAIPVPADAPQLQMGPALGVVIARTACRVSEAEALSCVAGYVVVNDVSVPHSVFYRPSIRFKARDGFCPIASTVMPATAVANPDDLAIQVEIDGVLRHESRTSSFVRPVARLIAELSDFMTLSAGDILLSGVPHGAPQAHEGQTVRIRIEGVGQLDNVLRPGEAR
jgi:5-oxopent-3-ene-1,2,5-tricarboxylate decarboxylase/2-hydroxyhepta-2,4-diene-1,7-dioate isomerase